LLRCPLAASRGKSKQGIGYSRQALLAADFLLANACLGQKLCRKGQQLCVAYFVGGSNGEKGRLIGLLAAPQPVGGAGAFLTSVLREELLFLAVETEFLCKKISFASARWTK
jgi:hypothetical protein